MSKMLVPIAISSIILVSKVSLFYLYRKYRLKYFKKLGIPGPDPHWFYGNLGELWSTDSRHILISNWTKKYGKIFGYYEGSTPVLVISDVEDIERLCIKQMNDFPRRVTLPFAPDPHKFPNSPLANIGTLWGTEWKRLRTICNSGFSTGKLKQYQNLIQKSQVSLIELLMEETNRDDLINIFDVFRFLTLDVIAEVAFGVELNSIKHRGEDNPILSKFEVLLKTVIAEGWSIKLGLCLPELKMVLQTMALFLMKFKIGILASFHGLSQVCESVIDTRMENPELRRKDILQLLIDASEKKDKQYAPLNKNEIISQCIQFFGAGFGTTSTTLGYIAHLLADHPEVQRKLYDELMQLDGENLDYDNVMNKLPYLDWVIHETIRMYPIGIGQVNRQPVDDGVQLGGVPISKDAEVLVDIYSVHNNPTFWGPVDPSQFHPERFSPEYPTTATRPTAAFLGFGLGPRHCIGKTLFLNYFY